MKRNLSLMEPSLTFKLRQCAPGDPHGPLRALCWKTYKQTPIANPLQNCSTASNGFAVKACPAVEELHKTRKCNFDVPAKRQNCKNRLAPAA